MISRLRSNGASLWTGVLFLSCLALFLTACTPKVLENRTVERVKPPAGLLVCEAKPVLPTADRLAADDGDNVLAAYWARVDHWGHDCWCAVEELRAFVDEIQPPAECTHDQARDGH